MKQTKYHDKSQEKETTQSPITKKSLEFIDFASRAKNQKVLNLISILLIAAVVISYYFTVIKYSINFPYMDDLEAILHVLRLYISSHNVHDKILLLWYQNNEHRLLFGRVIVLFEYYLFGQVNFRSLILVGNCALLVILIMLYKSVLLKDRVPLLYLVPFVFVLFNFGYYESAFLATPSLQHLWAPGFVLLSLYFLFSKKPYSIYLSILAGWIATYTSGNGMMVFIAGAFVLIINKEFFNFKNILWFLAGALAMATYFYHYSKPSDHPPIIKSLTENPLGFLEYIFTYLGGGLSFYNITMAITMGIILVLGIAFISFKGYYKSNPVIYALIIFILITSILAALTRFGYGLWQAVSSKYAIYSTLLLVCCYLAFLSMTYRGMKIFYFLVIMALAFYFNFHTYSQYIPYEKATKEEFDKNYALITHGKLSNFNYGWDPLDERIDTLPKRELKLADSLGIFKFKFTPEDVLLNNIPTDTSMNVEFYIDKVELVRPDCIFFDGWTLIKNRSADSIVNVLCFKDEKGVPFKYIITQKKARTDVTAAFNNEANYDNSGFTTLFTSKRLSPGKYTLAMFVTDSKYKTEINTGVQIEVSSGHQPIIKLLKGGNTSTPGSKLAKIKQMEMLAEQAPTPDSYLNLSREYYRNAMYKECIEICEKTLKMDPGSAMAYNNICACYNALGEYLKAEEACKKALQLNSTLELAKNNLLKAQINLRAGK